MKPVAAPTVFIVDDDGGVRRAIQDLVESVGLRAESFATAQDSFGSSGGQLSRASR